MAVPPGSPTCDQAGRFFALLVDLGMADALDALHQSTAPAPIDGNKPASLADVSGVGSGAIEAKNAASEPVVRFELGEMFRQIGHHDAYGRLAACIWDITEADGGRIPVEVLREEFFPFAVACSGPLKELTDFVLDWA